ncbi:hypothetical protein EV714DRAFT_203389 [Schizophyllum commune]
MSGRRNSSAKASASRRRKESSARPAETQYCICRTGDDGRPMVYCSQCDDWYHFECVDLTEDDAADIMTWEGSEAVEPVDERESKRARLQRLAQKKAIETISEDEESQDGASSEDEFVVESSTRSKGRKMAIVSDDEDSANDSDPSSSHRRKRKPTSSKPPPSKRKKIQPARGTSTSIDDDPFRKFTLGKFTSIFIDIFLRFPRIDDVEKAPGSLTPEETEDVRADAARYAEELEREMSTLYVEEDGRAGARYKDRFRMLTVNLSKKDRELVHKRIVARDVTPAMLAVMSVHELADAATQRTIKNAEREALDHSTLRIATAAGPRTKMTHKGFEEVEVDGPYNPREEQRQEEDSAREMTQTPITPRTPQVDPWGPPSAVAQSPKVEHSARPPLFMHTSTEYPMAGGEPELNIDDLINIDEEGMAAQTLALPTPVGEAPAQDMESAPPVSASPIEPVKSESASVEPETMFDLNSLWSAPEKEGDTEGYVDMDTSSNEPHEPNGPMDVNSGVHDGEDADFDMLLNDNVDTSQSGRPPTPPIPVAYEDTPQVWSGMINMPLDSAVPQDTPVIARQMGGKSMDETSPLWRTLFPADVLRIDGRVPVDKSSDYLLQSRMNPSRELVGVTFAPATAEHEASFKALSDFLVGKSRHGLVFPWGQRPKEHHPGRELYIIPLHAHEPLPEFMELMDDLKLPKDRTRDYLVGIYVLIRGKLVPPPQAPQQIQAPAPQLQQQLPFHTPTPPFGSTPTPTSQMYAPPPPVPAQPTPPLSLPNLSNIRPEALAAEVASLTPEQIQAMLQTLQGTALLQAAQPQPQPIPLPLPAWNAPPPPGGYPPPAAGGYTPPPGGYPPHGAPPYPGQPPYGAPPYNPDYDGYRGGGDRGGWNKRGGNRGRGRGRGGRGRDGERFNKADNGWGRGGRGGGGQRGGW